MPELTPGSEYLVAFLHSAGTATATGMGLIGLSWQELSAWIKCMDMENIVTPRDLKVIHLLSGVYAGECSKATKKDVVPPYIPKVEMTMEVLEEVREVVSEKVDDIFAAMLIAQKRD